jgi:hypothetical protein
VCPHNQQTNTTLARMKVENFPGFPPLHVYMYMHTANMARCSRNICLPVKRVRFAFYDGMRVNDSIHLQSSVEQIQRNRRALPPDIPISLLHPADLNSRTQYIMIGRRAALFWIRRSPHVKITCGIQIPISGCPSPSSKYRGLPHCL